MFQRKSEREREREREREAEAMVFLTFNMIIIQIFPENFIEIRQVVQKVFFFDVNYFSEFFRFFDISLLQKY